MKSHDLIDVVVGLYINLIKDLTFIDPIIQAELEWQTNHIHLVGRQRGLGLFTLTFPDACKLLETALREGSLPDVRPPFTGRKSKEDSRPGFLWGFWSLIFEPDGMLSPEPNVDAIAGLRQLLLFAKKLRIECDKAKVESTLLEFVEIDRSLPPSRSGTWNCDHPEWHDLYGHPLWGEARRDDEPLLLEEARPPAHRRAEWDTFRQTCRLVVASLGTFSPWETEPKHGPGVVADQVKVKHELPHYPRKLAAVFPPDWFASHDFTDRTVDEREFPSKVICVPKTQKGPRIIAAEPTAHQWCQGAIQRWLTRALGGSLISSSISLNDQEPSRMAALEASRSGLQATIDLSAASDRLSTRLVQYVFDGNRSVLDALHATRTRTFRMPDGQVHVARKFACMGSACTFPVQTIVFTIVCIAAILKTRGMAANRASIGEVSKEVRVFGDDIIVPSDCAEAVSTLLTECGLKINRNKSFWLGRFRESCGMDAYAGLDVTPAYFLEMYDHSDPNTLAGLVAATNNFHTRGYWNAADYLLNTVDRSIRKLLRVANRAVSQPCLLSYAPSEAHLQVRLNQDTHVMEVKAILVDNKTSTLIGSWESSLLQFFSERGSKSLLEEVLENKGPERTLGTAVKPRARLRARWVIAEDRHV